MKDKQVKDTYLKVEQASLEGEIDIRNFPLKKVKKNLKTNGMKKVS